jgi:predicted dehydrogenase
VRDDIAKKSGNRSPSSCHIKLKDSDVTAHIWRFLYDVARQYRESFDVYGTKKSFEWTLVENEPHVIHTAKKPEPRSRKDRGARLRPSVARTDPAVHLPAEIHDAEHLSFIQGGGHGGSHPHLVHEFVSALHRRSRSLAQRGDQRQLDLHRHLCPPVGHSRVASRSPARVHARVAQTPASRWTISCEAGTFGDFV